MYLSTLLRVKGYISPISLNSIQNTKAENNEIAKLRSLPALSEPSHP
jgi:hypothetical protein